MKTEQYLFDQYDLVEADIDNENEIESYFKDCGYDYFDDWIQGEYEDEVKLFVKVGNKFYDVYIESEVGSQRMDRGERMYFLEGIKSVTFYETEKPSKKPREIEAEEMLKYILKNYLTEINSDYGEFIEALKLEIRNNDN